VSALLFPSDVPGRPFEVLSPRAWIFRLPQPLKTPNATIWRPWTGLAADRARWERAFRTEIHEWVAMRMIAGWTQPDSLAWPHLLAHQERRHLTVTRYVPKRAHFIRDERNLQFSIKGLEDALVHAQLIVDDRREWLTCDPVTQHVSPDGKFYTVVLLQRPDLSGAEVRHGETPQTGETEVGQLSTHRTRRSGRTPDVRATR
jgi:hypothetical protein